MDAVPRRDRGRGVIPPSVQTRKAEPDEECEACGQEFEPNEWVTVVPGGVMHDDCEAEGEL